MTHLCGPQGLYGAYHAVDFVPRSLSAMYTNGVTQMMNQVH